jgi:hypothetical protein
MTFVIDDLPTIEDQLRRGRSRSVDTQVADAYQMRSASLDVVGIVGVSRALDLAERMQQRVFPGAALSALQAAASPSYTMYQDCGPYNYNATCDEACFGFAPHHMDPFYCATCAEQAADPVNNPVYNWHFVGSRGSLLYMDREPDVCAGRDAWKWKVGPCGRCTQSAVFRCHDGWKKYPNSSSWDPTICQGMVACDDRLTPC